MGKKLKLSNKPLSWQDQLGVRLASGGLLPRPVIRGETSPQIVENKDKAKIPIFIDWLSFTLPDPDMYSTKWKDSFAFLHDLYDNLPPKGRTEWTKPDDPFALERVYMESTGKGMFGYTGSAVLKVADPTDTTRILEIGRIAWGGESQSSKVLVQLNSDGCALLNPSKARQILDDYGATITRIDLAFDDFQGKNWSVEQAVKLYRAGKFKSAGGGRNPDSNLVGDWLSKGQKNKGRTIYVGKRETKILRVYEKGRQKVFHEGVPAQALESMGIDLNWTRWELELHNKDRVLPLAIIDRPLDYFLGAYHSFKTLFAGVLHDGETTAERIKTKTKEKTADLVSILCNLRHQYGKTLAGLRLGSQLDDEGIMHHITKPYANVVPLANVDLALRTLAELP